MGIYRQGHKVLRAIVQFVTVDMVDNLIRVERSTVGLLPHDALFGNEATYGHSRVVGQIKEAITVGDSTGLMRPLFARGAGPMAYRNIEAPIVAVTRAVRSNRGMNPLAAAASTWRALIRDANEALAPALAFRDSSFLGVTLTKAKIRTVFMPRFRLDWEAAATGAVHAISIAQ
jgi:hypothetical protein